ncbi:aegerolysin family protein [Azospirillum sp. ST 5-10]|uniref:aegerolysin family protein n=1 Tax=unclassified Azospirillum TaxID=2630922 RepID=UPI003F49C7FF
MSARSVTATVRNNTNDTLVLNSAKLDHGIWSENQYPPSTIAPGATGSWMAESDGFMTGVEGTVTYLVGSAGVSSFYFDNPYVGSNEYSASAPKGFQVVTNGTSGDNSTVSYTLAVA